MGWGGDLFSERPRPLDERSQSSRLNWTGLWFFYLLCTTPLHFYIIWWESHIASSHNLWVEASGVTHLLSRATLLPRTQLSCSWTHSAVLCKSAARPAVGGGLGLLWLASELRLSDVMDGCCLCGGGAGGRGGGPGWLDKWSPAKRQRKIKLRISMVTNIFGVGMSAPQRRDNNSSHHVQYISHKNHFSDPEKQIQQRKWAGPRGKSATKRWFYGESHNNFRKNVRQLTVGFS